MALLTWNDVKVLNPTTGLYEAYLTRTKQYTPGTGASCLNFAGWNQCTFIANGSFDSGEMLDGITPLMGQYIRYDVPANNYPHACDAIIKVIDENEFNNGQMVCPSTYVGSGCPGPPNNCTVDYNLLPSTDYSSTAQWVTGLPTLDFITYCCKKCTNYSPVSLNMVCAGGCTDPLALNYDPTQTIDDGSCMYNGCMDSGATNYNSQAVFDDGSCVYAGCTDPLASNYDPIATIDDGSCQCVKCCEDIDTLGNVSHILLSTSTTPCQCPTGWSHIPCGQYSGWECNPLLGSCSLVTGGAYSSQTECNTDCADCGCTKLLGTGHTDAYAIALSADCEEYCCDPDLYQCNILVVGDDEGVQVYDPITNNTSHLFDVNFADTKDIAAARSGNNGFIWVYKSSLGAGSTTFVEYAITMVPFTATQVRGITFSSYVVGKGMTYFGHNNNGEVILTLGAGTGSIQNYTLPIGTVDITVPGTATFAYALPAGYRVTGDILTQGGNPLNPLDVVLYDNSVTYKVGVISRNTGTVLDEHTISSAIMTGTTKMEGLFVDYSMSPGKIMGVTTDGRVFELLQNAGGGMTAGIQFAPTPSGQIDFINNVTETVYGADNISGFGELCAEHVIQMPDSWNCVVSNWGCTDPGTGLGQYSTLADCQANCVVTANCNPGSTAGNCKAVQITINNLFVDRQKHALQHISQQGNGMQHMNFNTIAWPNVINPSTTIPGICWMAWGNGGPVGITFQQKWKIRRIKCGQVHPTAYFYSWKQFVTYAAFSTGNSGLFNATCTYDIAQDWLYSTFGFMPLNQIKIYAEPCICFSHKCECVPILGPGGQYPDEITCLSVPCCPCKKCCRKNTPPYNTIYLATTLYPCKCPQGYSVSLCPIIQIPKFLDSLQNDLTHIQYLPETSAKCEKTCTNGSYYIPLEIDDEHCDCLTYGLDEAPPKCDLCCTDGKITKKLGLYSTICECDDGWYECETTPECDKLCISTAKETARRLLKPEWPNCDCPTGYEVYVDEIENTTVVTSSDSINCSRCNGAGEAETLTFGSGLCPDGWTVTKSFKFDSCGKSAGGGGTVQPPEVETSEKEEEETSDYESTDETEETGKPKYYQCIPTTNNLVGEKQQSCVPSDDGTFKTIEACLDSGCGGFMSCNEGLSVNGVKFYGKTYTPIVMCCESVIQSSKEQLTKDYCLKSCGGQYKDVWYPVYNAFGPNTMHDSLLSYMVRELLEPVRNEECSVGLEDTFKKLGFKRQ
jgi:hypothetical protein